MKNVIIAVAALAVGAAIGIAVFVVLERGSAAVPSGETSAERSAAKKNLIKDVSVSASAKSAEASSVKAEKTKSAAPVADEDIAAKAADANAEKKAKGDNPFPRYLDMFKNNPEALAAEFEKEAEADRARQREVRDKAIARLKLNAEQAAVFEKALDDLKNAILRHEQEEVDLIASGQMNMDTAADGRIWDSNLLLMDQCGADREKTVRDAAVELYNQLDVDSVSDSEKQKIIKWTTYNTSFSFDCYEPVLQVYDKVYKNMGFGNGIFSWCIRRQKK